MNEVLIKYPATCHAHWATGAVPACDQHAKELVKLGEFMGAHVPLTKLPAPAECSNCVNENKGKKDEQ